MDVSSLVFYLIGGLTLLSAIAVISFRNPIFCALALALTMTGAAVIFFTLGAYFVAGVQLIVYAGAVMVMFVMVVMLIDLKHEGPAFSRGGISTFLKFLSTTILGGTLVATAAYTVVGGKASLPPLKEGLDNTRVLAGELFTKYIFGFEAIGILLLVVLVGAIALARARGGTHHA
jgi:NADH-quinone oxidoreductase subunit J